MMSRHFSELEQEASRPALSSPKSTKCQLDEVLLIDGYPGLSLEVREKEYHQHQHQTKTGGSHHLLNEVLFKY
jgi:hypothetical protein